MITPKSFVNCYHLHILTTNTIKSVSQSPGKLFSERDQVCMIESMKQGNFNKTTKQGNLNKKRKFKFYYQYQFNDIR